MTGKRIKNKIKNFEILKKKEGKKIVNIFVMLLLVLSAIFPLLASGDVIEEQFVPSNTNKYYKVMTNFTVYQIITVTTGSTITRLKLHLAKYGSVSDDINISIYEGYPWDKGTVCASTSVSPASITTWTGDWDDIPWYEWNFTDFTRAVSVYTIELNTSVPWNDDDSAEYLWHKNDATSNPDPYSGGWAVYYTTQGGAGFVNASNTDMAFKIYGEGYTYTENFDDDTVGNVTLSPDNPSESWYCLSDNSLGVLNTSACDINATQFVGMGPGKSLHIGLGGTGNEGVSFNFTNDSGNLTSHAIDYIKFSVYPKNDTDDYWLGLYLMNGSTIGVLFTFNSGYPAIRVKENGTATTVQSYSANTWYNFSVSINWTDHTTGILINGIDKGWYAFNDNTVSSFNAFSIRDGDTNEMEAFVDSIEIGSPTAMYPDTNNVPVISNPSPSNGTAGVSTSPTLSVDIYDADGDSVTVTFKNASDNSVIGSNVVSSGSGTASATWSGLSPSTSYSWYVTADDGTNVTTSSTYSFTTASSDYNHSLVWLKYISNEYTHYKPYVKHPYGAYMNGLNLFLSSHTEDASANQADPDWLCWFNESNGTGGWHEIYTNETVNSRNTGGQVAFDDNGYIYTVWNGAWGNPAFHLVKSNVSYDIYNFTTLDVGFGETNSDSTSAGIQIKGDVAYITWRHGGSTVTGSQSVLRRYNLTTNSWIDSSPIAIYQGGSYSGDSYGVEQQWFKYDDRFDKFSMGIVWLQPTPHTFFGDTFVHSTNGISWYSANESAVSLPVIPSDAKTDNILMPCDVETVDTTRGWTYGETGYTPEGKPYILGITSGDDTTKEFNWSLWLWNGTGWDEKSITSVYRNAISVGIGDNTMCVAYAPFANNNTIKMSYWDGSSWHDNITLFSLPSDKTATTITSVIPKQYNEDKARFFVSYKNDTDSGKYHYAVAWFMVNISANASINSPPTISITSPSDDATVNSTVNITGTASDSDGSVITVQVKIDSGSWQTATGTTSWYYNWDTTAESNGNHTIYARSYDGINFSITDSITVTVNNLQGFTDSGTAEPMTFPDTDINATGWVVANSNYLVITNNNYTVDGNSKWVMVSIPTLLNDTLLEYLLPPGNSTGWKCYAKISEDDGLWHEVPQSNVVNGWWYINDSVWDYSFDIGDHMYIRWAFNASMAPDYAGVYSSYPAGAKPAWNISDSPGYPSDYEYNLTVTLTGEQPPNQHPPIKPLSPTPSNGDYISEEEYSLMQCLVYDEDGGFLSVSFYWENGTLIGTDSSVDADFGIASINFPDVQVNETYQWYAVADDGTYTNRSDNWTFTVSTGGEPPLVYSPSPTNGAINISLLPTLSVLVYDTDSDSISVTFYDSNNITIGIDTFVNQMPPSPGQASVQWNDVILSNHTYQWYAVADDGDGNVVRYPTIGYLNFTTGITYPPVVTFQVKDTSGFPLSDVNISCSNLNQQILQYATTNTGGFASFSFNYNDIGQTYDFVFKKTNYTTVKKTYTISTGQYYITLQYKATPTGDDTTNPTDIATIFVNYAQGSLGTTGLAFLSIILVILAMLIASKQFNTGNTTTLFIGASLFGLFIAIGWIPFWLLLLPFVIVALMFGGKIRDMIFGKSTGGDES